MTTEEFKSIVRDLAKTRKFERDLVSAMGAMDLWDELADAATKAGCTDAESVGAWIEKP